MLVIRKENVIKLTCFLNNSNDADYVKSRTTIWRKFIVSDGFVHMYVF